MQKDVNEILIESCISVQEYVKGLKDNGTLLDKLAHVGTSLVRLLKFRFSRVLQADTQYSSFTLVFGD